MAKRSKSVDVSKFGGVEELGTVKEVGNQNSFKSEMSGSEYNVPDVSWETQSIEAQSKVTLEQDEGYGRAVVIRRFEFGINHEAFAAHTPTKQELFNYHLKGIEMELWKDGLKVLPDVEPRLSISKNTYSIFIAAIPFKGNLLKYDPQTLSQIAHG